MKQIVWSRIFDVTALFFDDIMAFHEMMYQQRSAETEKVDGKRVQKVDIVFNFAGEINFLIASTVNIAIKAHMISALLNTDALRSILRFL